MYQHTFSATKVTMGVKRNSNNQANTNTIRIENYIRFMQPSHTHTTVLWPFFRDYPSELVPEESSSGLYVAREDYRGRDTDNPAGCHSIRTNQRPTSIIPHFYARCPSCRNPTNLSWLGTGTKYAGMHSKWPPLIINDCRFLSKAGYTCIQH